MSSKPIFRKKLLLQRSALSDDARQAEDAQIARAICNTPQFEDAECVLAYLSFGSEVDTHAIIETAHKIGKVIAAPRCVEGTRDMRWFEIAGAGCLERSDFGMEEPKPELCREIMPAEYNRESTIAIVPGLAFDKQGYRIGYGGGFYDRFLDGFRGTSIGICRTGFLYDDLVAEKAIDRHDMPVDMVITPLSVAD